MIPESLRWLYVNKKFKKLEQIIKRIAIFNQKRIGQFSITPPDLLRKTSKETSYLDLINTKTMAYKTFVITFGWYLLLTQHERLLSTIPQTCVYGVKIPYIEVRITYMVWILPYIEVRSPFIDVLGIIFSRRSSSEYLLINEYSFSQSKFGKYQSSCSYKKFTRSWFNHHDNWFISVDSLMLLFQILLHQYIKGFEH